MYEVNYHRAKNLADATAKFGAAGEGRYLAGGQTLLPTMKQHLAAPSDLIDLRDVAELKGIAAGGDLVTIGAGTTHADVAKSEAVRMAIPALARLAGLVGDPAVRHRGTLGGSIANNDPAADYPAALVALGATVHTDRRQLPAGEFFTGLFATALEEGEIVVRVAFPVPEKAAYEKFRNPASRYAMAGVFVARMKDGSVRAGVTGAGSNGVFRSEEIEKALAANFSERALVPVWIDPAGMLSDIHGSAEYRANLVKVMARRAVKSLG